MAGVDADAETYHQPPPDDFDEDSTEYTQHGQKILFKPNPGPQEEFLAATEREVLFGGAAGGGKVVLEYQSVLTPSGFKNCRDLLEGDTICDPKGGLQVITQVHPWQTNEKWEVELDDGTVYDTVAGHLWYYWIAGKGEKGAVVKTTEQMKNHMDSVKRNPILPSCLSTQLDSRPYPSTLPPYLLGVLLGDGCLVNNSISMTSHENDWEHYQTALDLPSDDLRVKEQTIRFTGETRYKIVSALKSYGLVGIKSNKKFVPENYLWNTELVRLEVLRGLMDTDGYRDPTRARAEFSTVSPRLAENVTFLARSLGYRVSAYEKIGSYKNELKEKVNCQKVYRLYITGYDVDNIFKMPRKRTGVLGKQTGRRVVRVEKVGGNVNGRCITVSAEHSLYISDDFVVTHNSYAMLADPMRSFDIPQFSGLLLRRTTEELRELIWKSQELYSEVFLEDMKFGARSNSWVHKNGGRLWMTYLDRDEDVLRYQGQAYNWIGFDELTQWASPFPWNYLRSRLRTTTRKLPLYMRASSNPGNVGGWWVRKMFIDPAPPGTPFWATDIETGEVLRYPDLDHHKQPHRFAGQPLFQRRFIPSTLKDNPYLYNTGEYEANLLALPEIQRKQLLEGSWDVVEGAAFPEFSRPIHVIKPYPLPDSWLKFRGCDYGYTSFSGVVWCCLHPSGQIIVYRDLEVSKVTAYDLVDLLANIEKNDNVSYGVLDWSVFRAMGDRGKSLEQDFHRHRMRWRKADRSKGSRVAGKNEIHRRLQTINEITGEPELVFFENATNCIQQIPIIPLDRNNPDDVDTNSRDHVYDALRYAVNSRPNPGKNPVYLDYSMSRRTISNPYAVQREPSDPVFGY